MDFNTVLGVVAGFALSVILWFATAKWLVARINVPKVLYEKQKDDTCEYSIRVENHGHRDAVDVTVKCTLFSTGWGTDSKSTIATIDVPISTGQIDVMPGRRSFFKEDRKISEIGPRVVTLKFHAITPFQKDKLSQPQQRQLEARKMKFEELAGFGDDSFLSVVVYANDRFSGARNVYFARELTKADVRPIPSENSQPGGKP